MISALVIIVLSQIPITGSSAFTRVPYNTPLGYNLANSQPPLGYYTFNPPGIANPKVITFPEPIEDVTKGVVIDFNTTRKQVTVRQADGTISVFYYNERTKWDARNGKLDIYVGKSEVNIKFNQLTILN